MGFFDIFRKKKVEEVEENEFSVPEIPPCVPTAITGEKEDQHESGTPKSSLEVVPHRKRLLKDFFEIDILSLKPNEGETRIVLEEPLMGMFYYVEFHYISDGTINMEFLSLSKRFSKEVIDFVESCANTFGPTKQGETVITQRDHQFLLRGVFSRMWNKIWLECSTDSDSGLKALCLTIFNVEETANYIMEI